MTNDPSDNSVVPDSIVPNPVVPDPPKSEAGASFGCLLVLMMGVVLMWGFRRCEPTDYQRAAREERAMQDALDRGDMNEYSRIGKIRNERAKKRLKDNE